MQATTLYEVRCPNDRWKGNTNNQSCNNLCGRVNALTIGEFHCRKCKILFNFTVGEEGKIEYFFERTQVKHRYTNKTAEDRLLRLVNGEE